MIVNQRTGYGYEALVPDVSDLDVSDLVASAVVPFDRDRSARSGRSTMRRLVTYVVSHRPANDQARKRVLDGGEVQPALPSAQVGDVREPQHVRRVRPKPTLDQIVSDPHAGQTDRGPPTLLGDQPGQAGVPHQPLDPLTADVDPVRDPQLHMDPPSAIRATVLQVDLSDPLGQPRVRERPARRRAHLPLPVTGPDKFSSSHARETGNPRAFSTAIMRYTLTGDRSPGQEGRGSFEQSCSRSSRAFSRLSRRSSSHSALVSPSSRLCRSSASCLAQLRNDCSVIPSAPATSSTGRPGRTIATASRRNSGGYGGRDFGMQIILAPLADASAQMTTKPGEVHPEPQPGVGPRFG
jgi:hypothetical protein